MSLASQAFALLAALIHVLIFGLESLWFMRRAVYRRFGAASEEEARILRLFAFNQGYYNLFLALGVGSGLWLLHAGGNPVGGQVLVLFACACMAAASVVLLASAGARMLRAALIQGAPPLLALLLARLV